MSWISFRRACLPVAVVYFSWLVACPVMGQALVKTLPQVSDYGLWSRLHLQAMSPDGNWICYANQYETTDTTYVQSIDGRRKFAIPQGYDARFSAYAQFGCMTENGLNLIDLKTGFRSEFAQATKYNFAFGGAIVVSRGKTFEIYGRDGKSVLAGNDVSEWALSPDLETVAFVSEKNGAQLFSIKKRQRLALRANAGAKSSNIAWRSDGAAMVWISDENAVQKLCYFDMKTGILETSEAIPASGTVASESLDVSASGMRVFYKVRTPYKKETAQSDVEIWNGNAPLLYPLAQKIDGWKAMPKLWQWNRKQNTHFQITDTSFPKAFLSGDKSHAITFDPFDHEPQFKQVGDVNFYITDLDTGKRELFLKDQCGDLFHTLASPAGKYIAYFNDSNWFVYDIANKAHVNLTAKTQVSFADELYDMAGEEQSYGIAGFSENDKSLLVYDRFDIWEIALPNGQPKRLTRGRERELSFRCELFRPNTYMANYHGYTAETVLLSKRIPIQILNVRSRAVGYGILNKGKIRILHLNNDYSHNIVASKDEKTFAFVKEKFDDTPEICLLRNGTEKPLFKSNRHQSRFLWGKSGLVHYKNEDGKPLSGILYFPAGYDKAKSYPMVVHVYQRQTQFFNHYTVPTVFSGDGFNVTDYTLRGYFVLLPDIAYTLGKPGHSAVDCVSAAVGEVKRLGYLNSGKIGLIGQSFGGYETNFIVTQMSLFDAAVSGSGVADAVSFYNGMGWDSGKADIWRFESHQWRMGKSLYEAREAYLENSPILYADKITTPLLIWTGSEDKQVNAVQSLELYLGMRRLGKKNILLRYPDERHSIEDSSRQKDLTLRIAQWFDHFLKDDPPTAWITEGLK